MSPFALDTWSVVGNLPKAGTPSSPFNLAYSAQQDVLIAGRCSSGPILTWNPGELYRSVDQGETWTLVHDFNTSPGPDGFNSAPVSIALLRDEDTGAERFVAAVVRIDTFAGATQSTLIRMYYSDDGLTWTPGTLLVNAPGVGVASTGSGATSVATRQRGGPSQPDLEHYIVAAATRDAVTSRGVFKSTDLGKTWTLVGDTAPIGVILGGFYFTSLVTRPNRHLMLGEHQGLGGSADSPDGGQTWQPGSPQFVPTFALAFDPGTLVGVKPGSLTTQCETRICCSEVLGWPPGNQGPVFGLSGGTVTNPVLINLGKWEVILAAGTSPLGVVDIVYSDNGGETEAERALVDTGSGIVCHLSGGVMLKDGRPLILVGSTAQVLRSSDVPAGIFGTRTYCVLAPAPGVGFPDAIPLCGPFYNPCPQTVPDDPEQPEPQVVPNPPDFIPGEAVAYGELELGYGEEGAIYGGTDSIAILYPSLGRPAGCGATFTNQPCAAEACP